MGSTRSSGFDLARPDRRFQRPSRLIRKSISAGLVTGLMVAMLVALPTAGSASPLSAQATETYVAIGSPQEIETIDSNTGSEVGSPVALSSSYTPVAMAEYSPSGSTDSQVLVAEANGSTGYLQEVDPLTGGRLGTALAGAPTAIAIADHSTTKAYGLVLEPALDEVQVVNVPAFNIPTSVIPGSVTLGLGTTASGLTFNPDGEYAYVTDASTHTVVTLGFTSVSPYFQVIGTPYTGSSSFDPTSITVSNAGTTAYVSDGNQIEESSLSSGEFVAPTTLITLAYTAGTSSISADDSTLYVQGLSGLLSSYVADITIATPAVTYWPTGVTAGPLSLSIDGGTLAVASASSSALELISTISGSVENTASLDGAPVAVTPAAAVPLGLEAFVTEKTGNSVAMVDLTTGALDQTVNVGSEPVAVAVTPNGQYAFVANYGDSSVSVLQNDNMDTPSPVNIATISLPMGSEPDAIAVSPDGDRVLVVDEETGEISVIDSNPNDGSSYLTVIAADAVYLDGSGTSSTTMLPDAIALSPDGNYAYVTDGGDATVSVLSLSSPDTYAWQWNSSSLSFSGEPQDIAISPNDQTAYVTDSPTSGDGYLHAFRIDPQNGVLHTTFEVTATVGLGPSGVALSPSGSTAYVTDSTSPAVSIVNTVSNTVAPLSAVGTPTGVGVSPDGSLFLAASAGSTNQLSIWNATSDSVVSTISLSGLGPTGIAVSPVFNNSSDGPLTNYEGDVNPSVAATSSIDVEDGVDTATGGYTLNLNDLSLPDIGIGLDLSQEYASTNSSVNGPLGYGWSFSYGMTLTQAPYVTGPPVSGCNITIDQENGTPVTFFLQPKLLTGGSCATAGYEAPSWEQASLTYVASCYSGNPCWDMTRDGTTQYLFSTGATSGNPNPLMFEKDLNGNLVTLTYSGGNLSTVKGASDVRELTFTWSGSNISQVEDSAGRTATFTYSGNNLKTVTLVATSTGDTVSAHEWAFTYNSSHKLTDWWSPDNVATDSSYPCTLTAAFNDAVECEATQIGYGSAQVSAVADPEWTTQCNGSSGTTFCLPTTTFVYPSYDATTDTGTVIVSDPDENFDELAPVVNDGNGNTTLDRYVGGVLVSQAKGYGYETDTSASNYYADYAMASAVSTFIPDPFTWLPSESLDGDGYLTTTSYDASGNALQSTDPLGNTTSDVYNRFNDLVQQTDPMGYVTSYSYDDDGNKLSATNGTGATTSYAYSSDGEQCAMLSADGHAVGDSLTSCPTSWAPYVTAYGYDAEGDQTSVTAYNYNATTLTDLTYVTSQLYNAAGELCASLTADGYAATDRIPSSCPTSGAAFETVSTAFDAFGNVLSSISPTNASGGTTTTTYDADGNELVSTDPSSEVRTSTYGPNDQLCWTESLSVSSPTCGSPPTGTGTETTSYLYDPDGNQVSSVAPDGNVTTGVACLYETSSTFDNLGNTLTTTTPTGGTTCSNVTESTTTYTYDPNGSQLTSVDGAAITTTSTYNADGELCWSDVAAVSTPTCASVPGSGTVTSDSYDADGNELTVTDPSGDVTTSTYNADNQLCWSEPLAVSSPACGSPPAGSGTETTSDYYDADGNVVAVTDPDGDTVTCDPASSSSCPETTYNSYDEQNQELTTTNQSGDETGYTYDADGAVLTTTQQTGSAETSTYNGAGQVTQDSYTETPTVSYQYGANGETCWMYQGTSTAACGSPPSGATTYSYDSSGRLISETNAAGATTTYGYDGSSNVTCVSYPNTPGNTCSSSGTPTGVVRYTYNQTSQLTSLTDWAGDTLTFTYNGDGQQCWVSTYSPTTPSCASPPHQASSITTAETYDTLGNVAGIQTTTGTTPTNLLNLAVANRNPDENILAETPTVGATAESADDYGYSDTDQVATGPTTGSLDAYTYLAMGSVTADTSSFTHAGYTAAGALCWTYTGTSSAPCSTPPTGAGATAYSANTDGERTGMTPSSGTSASYGWETDSGLLTCANTDGTTCSTSSPTATTTLYTYDGNGLRTSATIGSTTTNFTWGTLGGNSSLLADGTWDYVYANGGATPIEQIATTGSSPAVDLLASDESGNIRGLVQLSSGTHQYQLVNYTDYDAYGDAITASGGVPEAGGLTAAHTGINSNFVGTTPWGYGEGYADATGLVFLINRYYDPVTGQFISVDPLLRETAEPYEYAADVPTASSDPLGESPRVCTPHPCIVRFPPDALQAAKAAYQAGFRAELVDFVAIAGSESGWTYNVATHCCYGMWEINLSGKYNFSFLHPYCAEQLTDGHWENPNLNADCLAEVRGYVVNKLNDSPYLPYSEDPIVTCSSNKDCSVRYTSHRDPCDFNEPSGEPAPDSGDCLAIAQYAVKALG